MALLEGLAEPLKALPPVEFAFSYGSGVFPQAGNDRSSMLQKPMVDYVLGVSCPVEWHSKNIEMNPQHYSSCLANFGGKWVSTVADRVGVGVHFNPFVPWKGKTIKYGVIGMAQLKRDVSTWNSLYISGRLQKPVCILVDNEGLGKLNEMNLNAALFAALLLEPSEFTEGAARFGNDVFANEQMNNLKEELYMRICELSYMGDVRMLFAEDRHKVQKIVRGGSDRFHFLYRDVIHRAASSGLLGLPSAFGTNPQLKLHQSGDASSVLTMLAALPSTILNRLASYTGAAFDSQLSGRIVAEAVVQARDGHSKLLRHAIGGVVRRSSIRQMVSGVFAAGGAHAFQYVVRKVSKAWQSR